MFEFIIVAKGLHAPDTPTLVARWSALIPTKVEYSIEEAREFAASIIRVADAAERASRAVVG